MIKFRSRLDISSLPPPLGLPQTKRNDSFPLIFQAICLYQFIWQLCVALYCNKVVCLSSPGREGCFLYSVCSPQCVTLDGIFGQLVHERPMVYQLTIVCGPHSSCIHNSSSREGSGLMRTVTGNTPRAPQCSNSPKLPLIEAVNGELLSTWE